MGVKYFDSDWKVLSHFLFGKTIQLLNTISNRTENEERILQDLEDKMKELKASNLSSLSKGVSFLLTKNDFVIQATSSLQCPYLLETGILNLNLLNKKILLSNFKITSQKVKNKNLQ